jgi:hypothetical protein
MLLQNIHDKYVSDDDISNAELIADLAGAALEAPSEADDFDMEDFVENKEIYTDDEVKTKSKLPQWDFVKNKLEEMKNSSGNVEKFVLPFPDAPGNSGVTVSSDETLSSYLSGCRDIFKIILFILGVYYWIIIIMGVFV